MKRATTQTRRETYYDHLNVKINPNFYEDDCKTLELSKRLYPLYIRANYEEKAKILAFVTSNHILLDSTLCPIYRKPFGIIAKGLSRPIKFRLLDEFRTFLTSELSDSPVFEDVGKVVTQVQICETASQPDK